MGLRLTPIILESSYRFLQNTSPFRSWKLPHADGVSFRVMRTPDFYGAFWVDKGTPTIEISSALVGHTMSLMEAMAHEMTHMYQWKRGRPAAHNDDWKRCVSIVCKYHGFDPKAF